MTKKVSSHKSSKMSTSSSPPKCNECPEPAAVISEDMCDGIAVDLPEGVYLKITYSNYCRTHGLGMRSDPYAK